MKNQVVVDGSGTYIAEVQRWSNKFRDLMKTELYAPISIVAYYLPHQGTMIGCPLGDQEYQSLGERMRTDDAMFTAAERTGLIAEGIDAIFRAALDNCDNWAYYAKDVDFILKHTGLHKHVSFSDRCYAEALLAGGNLFCEDEDLWLRCCSTIQKKLSARQTRGYAY